MIEMRVPEEKRIAVAETDAANFACNAVNMDRTIILNKASAQLKESLAWRASTSSKFRSQKS